MAETTDFGVVQDYVLTFADGAGTPKTYAVQVEPGVGSIKLQTVAFGETQMMTSAGVYTGQPRKTVQTRHAEIQVSKARVKDRGANTTEAVLTDILEELGYVLSTWTSTETPADRRAYTVTLAAQARSGGVAAVTHTMTDAWIVHESVDYEHTVEGVFASFTIRANSVTTTRA